ncbi:MAG: hypothetical protein Q8N47_20425, partial [Bryobacterales bacterium]|nr:hypothetical protein [Bryobacterales bacterium]
TYPEEGNMTKRIAGTLSVLTVLVLLAVPLAAQTRKLKADIPFEFTAGSKVMPAGEYSIVLRSDLSGVAQLVATDAKESAFAMGYGIGGGNSQAESRLTFNKYGNQYFLAEVWTQGLSSGVGFQKSRTERELSRTASARQTITLQAKR